MRSLKKLVLTGLLFYSSFNAMAWGVLGHRIVGQIAESYLTPKAKLAIKTILGNESIAMSSNWADFIRSDSSYSYLTDYHYINLTDSINEVQLKKYLLTDTAKDVYTEINFLIKELKKKNLAKDKQQMYLRLLVHFVGDVHQPLHVSREEDWGGNKIKVQWFKEQTNLHSVWDEKLIDFQQLSYTEYAGAINYVTPSQKLQWQKTPLYDWVFESHELAVKIYNGVSLDNPKLGYRYNYDNIHIINAQLLKAGVRLAGILNEIFG
ncbi:S1/P1 nuclease [Ferruginibacter albus]|uniref:S1/P1 nuclease n=1 Tax=Ferruginibacter albus TaxID=2875540 RepID=UPI001CC4C61E|nr:S1/P1 nuclease [Ferruginibacter albus]UAY50609.1 S1/P1 nuclease [Ferruginibacter albus]